VKRLVGEFKARIRWSSPGVFESVGREECRHPALTLVRLSLPSKRTPYPVVAIRFTTPATPFLRPRGFPEFGRPTPERRQLPWAWTPLQGHRSVPAGSRRNRLPSRGFAPLQRHQPGGPLTRASNPVRSAFRFSQPLDGFLPPAPSGHEGRCHSWGSPCRAFPPRGAVRLSAPVTFMLFLTSRSAALRTRRSRCPAASRSCSPRRSVPFGGRSRSGPILSWAFPLLSRACPLPPWIRLPGPFPPALSASSLRERGRPALQGLVERSARRRPRGPRQLS